MQKHNLVRERLYLAKSLLEYNERLRDPSLIKNTENNGWTHPYLKLDALVNYLLLTCFDILGSPSDWLSFDSWLVAKRSSHKNERDHAVNGIGKDATLISIAQHLYNAYLKIYGMRNNFYNFIDNVLDNKSRAKLLSNIHIYKIVEEGKLMKLDNDNTKKKFLFETRNIFTHEALPTGTPAYGVFTRNVLIRGNDVLWGEEVLRRNDEHEYRARYWPFGLFELISKIINERIDDFDVKFDVGVELDSGKTIWMSGVKYQRLKKPEELRNEAEMFAARDK